MKLSFVKRQFLTGTVLGFALCALGVYGYSTRYRMRVRPVPAFAEPTPTPSVSPAISQPTAEFRDIYFPEVFFFGTASSDFQTTGGNGLSDWEEHIASFQGKKVGPGVGSDFFRRYREDFDQARGIGIQIHRISLEWSRIEPQEGVWDMRAAQQYQQIFLYMRSRGIEPMICLNHFTLPKWFAERGGWEHRNAADSYGKYARFVAENIGKPVKVRWWLTFNEPQITLKESYITGKWPPHRSVRGATDQEGIRRLIRVTANVMDAHRMAYDQIHKALDTSPVRPMVGWASWAMPFYPKDPKEPLDVIAATLYGTLDTIMLDELTGRYKDFIGLNYYTRAQLKGYVYPNDPQNPISIGWEGMGTPYPRGLYDLIMMFKNSGLPIIITENGVSGVNDNQREEFLVTHLKAVHQAILDGAYVIGYMYWTLSDTWEWGGEFSLYGLLAVDRDNGYKRKPRPAATTYGHIIKMHGLPKDLQEKHKAAMP